MTTTERTHNLTSTDWSELSRLIDARESALLELVRGGRAHEADTSAYEAAINELRTWMDEHTDWSAA